MRLIRRDAGLSGMAFRSRQPCIINDYLADPRSRAFHARARRTTAQVRRGVPAVGARAGRRRHDVHCRPKRTRSRRNSPNCCSGSTDNVSFALENFDRADEKTKADERIEYLASHDSLTNLPNREMFNGLLRRTIDAAARYQRQFAVLFIDLDRFKVINNSLGHDAGDMLLVEIGGTAARRVAFQRRRGAARRRRIRRDPGRSRRTCTRSNASPASCCRC